MFKFLLNKFFVLPVVALATVATFSLSAVSTHASASLQGGDFFQAFNNTTQEGTWRDPVTGTSGNVIEFRVTAKNNGDQVAHRVQVWGSVTGQVPQDPANTQVLTARISNADFGGQELTDTATINITGTPEGMRYVPGHARLNGVTNLYNCASACDIPDNVLGGIEVGDIQPGDFVEVTYKAYIVNNPNPSPSPSPSASPSVSPSPSPSASPSVAPSPSPSTPGNTVSCPEGFTSSLNGNNIICIQNNNNNNNTNTNNNSSNNSSTNSSSSSSSATGGSVTINTTTTTSANTPATVAVAGVSTTATTLPKTGLPLIAWGALAFTPAGVGLKKFKKGNKALESASYIWEQREFKKS